MATVPLPRVYDDFIDFIAERVSADEILAFKASAAAQRRARRLLERLKDETISMDERAELEQMAQVDLLLGRLKAQAAAQRQSK